MVSVRVIAVLALILSASGSWVNPVGHNVKIFKSEQDHVKIMMPKPKPQQEIKVIGGGFSYSGTVSGHQSEDVEFAVNSTESGYAQVTSVGLTVTAGTSATLDFRIRVRAIDAQTLENSDSLFMGTLSESEREEYEQTKTSYNGGLGLSLGGFLGINLGGKTEKIDMERAAERDGDYNLKSAAAREMFESVVETDLEINGTLTATGTSQIPSTVFAFIKLAKVELLDGSTKTVVTSTGDELVAATETGQVVPSEGGQIEILEI